MGKLIVGSLELETLTIYEINCSFEHLATLIYKMKVAEPYFGLDVDYFLHLGQALVGLEFFLRLSLREILDSSRQFIRADFLSRSQLDQLWPIDTDDVVVFLLR